MRLLLNVIFVCGYGGLAAAVALIGPDLEPWLGPTRAYALAGVVLLGGALLHEVHLRGQREADLVDHMAALERAVSLQREQLAWFGRELETLREGLSALQREGGALGGRTLDEVLSEVKVLRSLVPRLSEPEDRTDDSEGADHGRRPAVAPAPVSGRTTEAAALPPVAQDLGPEEILEVVRTALREDRVELVLQPIVSLPQRRRRFYECFSRLRTPDGAMIRPEQYIHLAERAGLVTAIDNMLLFRCVQLVRKIHRRNDELGFFCNISPYTLADVDFFADFVAFLENNRELAGHLVFEFAQADFERWSETGARLLDRLAALGCRFSLDQVSDLDLRPRILAARQVRFVKIEAGVLRARLAEGRGLLRALRRHGIDLIVEKVEEEGNLLELLDYEIDFGQGFLFGEPRLARPAA